MNNAKITQKRIGNAGNTQKNTKKTELKKEINSRGYQKLSFVRIPENRNIGIITLQNLTFRC